MLCLSSAIDVRLCHRFLCIAVYRTPYVTSILHCSIRESQNNLDLENNLSSRWEALRSKSGDLRFWGKQPPRFGESDARADIAGESVENSAVD